MTRLAQSLLIEVTAPVVDDGRQYTVYADGKDVTWEIRTAEVNRYVSPVSAYAGVRIALTQQQRRIASAGGVIMVGRDIGTVVLPEAEVKIYLDASLEERARRRHLELLQRGQRSEYSQVLEDLKHRDGIDSTRREAPLCAAKDAVVIDSTDMSVERVAAQIEAIAVSAACPRVKGNS